MKISFFFHNPNAFTLFDLISAHVLVSAQFFFNCELMLYQLLIFQREEQCNLTIPDRHQSKTLLTIDECRSKIARNSVFDCHMSPFRGQMAIKNYVSIYFLSMFVDSINIFLCHLSCVLTIRKCEVMFVCLFVLILYMSRPVFLGWTSTKWRIKCLAQGHNTVPPLRLEPVTPRSLSDLIW